MANYVQFGDAYVSYEKMQRKKIKNLTIHDSLDAPIECRTIEGNNFWSYLEIFDENFLIKHFGSTPLVAQLNSYKINNNYLSFSRDEIKKDFLLKYKILWIKFIKKKMYFSPFEQLK